MTKTTGAPVLSTRALNRATLDRQLLLRRAPVGEVSVSDAVERLIGLQAQEVKPPYFALAARLEGFAPEALSGLIERRELVRIVTLRSTIHLHTAADALGVRPLVQVARRRELNAFRKGLVGVDLDELAVLARALVEEEPRTMKQLRAELSQKWPDGDPQSLAVAARCLLPLVQVTPRGLWRRSGQVALTTVEKWVGRGVVVGDADASGLADLPGLADLSGLGGLPGLDDLVLRYLRAFGPASVKDFQTWAGLTRTRDAFERLRPGLRTFRSEAGVELFDLADAPLPDEDTSAPVRFLPEFDNLLLSHADRTRVIPAAHWGRSWKGNIAYRTFLVDGFLAGVWALDEGRDGRDGGDVLTVQPFGALSRAQRGEVQAEAARTLDVLGASSSYDIRFGTVIPG
ncbi:winged helix DNA-binding domain-containing protein [Streptomyces sp. NPDC059009]|uniref:winged helix DNA-binding domain-containing protein n=1 Tax=Streptomyces sp. NPDC059009 TaxID=3346694 RepID=UPI00369DA0B5